jgi:putative ABC transport system permease protein
MFSDLRFRLRALFNRAAMERELDDELRFHMERETEKYVRAGIPRAEAERRARIALGGVDRIKDDTRDTRGIAMIDTVRQDLRYAWRGLRSRPGLTTAIVLTLALGIGANAAMFGIVDRLLFRPPAYLVAPDRVHRIYLGSTNDGRLTVERTTEYTRYQDLTRWTSSFERTAAVAYRELAIGAGEEAHEMTVAAMSATFFGFFNARPALGRFFGADEDHTPTGAQVAVLGYGFWQSGYGGRANVLGEKLYIGNAIYTVIGVAPEGFAGVTEGTTPAAFIPITTFAFLRNQSGYFRNYNWGWLEVFVRRKPGVSSEAANSDLTAAYARSWEVQRQQDRIAPAAAARPYAFTGAIQLARGPEASQDSKIVKWVMGVAAIVLLVACANVANLLLAHAVKRRREIALRLALGVTRLRLLQQLLTETVLLAALGGATGLAVAQWGGRTLRALFLPAENANAVLSDGRTVFFAIAVTVGVALLTGLAPAFHAIRGDVADALKAGSREGTYRRSRVRSALLLFQGALSVVLLVGAGLFVRSLANVRALRLGYDVAPVVYLEGNMRGTSLKDPEQNALNERLYAAAASTPGVRSATLTISVPFWSNEGRSLHVPGIDSVRKLGRFMLQAGSPTYFETVGTRIMRGRGITTEDRAGSQRVVIVSEAMARILWPGKDAIGQQMRISSDTTPFWTVVGIAEDARGRQLRGDPEFWYYLPMAQYVAYISPSYPAVFARVNGRAEDFVEVLRRRLQLAMPGAAYITAVPLRKLVAPSQRSWEFGATMFVAFGALALVLAAIGLYSVIAYAVAQRTHELGVRIALGAGVGDVVRMIVGQGVTFALAGIAIGSVIALWAGRWVQPLLFAQKARDPTVYAGVAVVLIVVAIVATLRPALRATRVDPTVALRAE